MWQALFDQARTLVIKTFLQPMFVYPFEWLYREGPIALGFWGGLQEPDICAQLTKTNAIFWNASEGNRLECRSIIDRHFWSWMVLASVVGYVSLLTMGVRRVCAQAPAPIQMVVVRKRRIDKKTTDAMLEKP